MRKLLAKTSCITLLVLLFLAGCSKHESAQTVQPPKPVAIPTYSVGGTLSGLGAGNQITLTLNGKDTLPLSANGAFTFPNKLPDASAYDVTLAPTTPVVQPCTLQAGSGTLKGADIVAVQVVCSVVKSPDDNAGRVLAASGTVQLTAPDGQHHAVSKGDAVNEGDTLSAGADATAKIRMRDGGLLFLRPDTQVKIDRFRFDGKQDGSEQSFFTLLKGGFRAVTGWIGKIHKQDYHISTAAGEIGIRGTDHDAYVVTADSESAKLSPVGTYDKVNRGETTLTNRKGMVAIQPDQMGFVAAPNQQPKLLPVNQHLFTVSASAPPPAPPSAPVSAVVAAPVTKVSYPFDGTWETKLVCDDSQFKGQLVKGYSWDFDVKIENGKLTGQYGQVGAPSSVTYTGEVQQDGSTEIRAEGNTGNPDYTVGKVQRGTPYFYQMTGMFSGTSGHATRTKLRPCEATFSKR